MILVLAALIAAPAGWTGGANIDVVHQVGGEGHFGGVHGIVEGERWDGPKVVLYASRISATVSGRDAAARGEIDQLHRPTETAFVETPHDKLWDVTMAWKDAGVHGDVRMMLTGTGDAVIVEAKGECIAADDAKPADVAACQAALKTLDPAIDEKNRVEIKPSTSTSTSTSTMPAPTMSDGSHVPLPPIVIKQEKPATDRRPIYVGAGVVLLAAAFWWNRRRRADYEREEKSDG